MEDVLDVYKRPYDEKKPWVCFDERRPTTSAASSSVEFTGEGTAGGIKIDTRNLSVLNGGQLLAGIRGQGDAGTITINASDSVIFDGLSQDRQTFTGAQSAILPESEGNPGNIFINTNNISVFNGAQISAVTFGKGNGGNVTINASDSVVFDRESSDGNNSGVFSQVISGAEGNAGGVEINTASLQVLNGGQIDTSTFGKGDAGSVTINASDSVIFDGEGSDGISSGAYSSVQLGGVGKAGGLKITTNSLSLTNGAALFSGTLGQGQGGELTVNANSLKLDNDALITSRTSTTFEAGNVTLNITDSLLTTDSEISTRSIQSSGGNLTISAGDIQLRGNSDIRTDINSGVGGGGNINLTADSIIAFDDSDIFAFATDGKGGNINLNTPAYFAENFTLNSLTSNPEILENNNRADVNATGAVSGTVTIPDVSFIQDGLNDLPDNSINTDELVANSCVSPVGNRQEGKFIITGKGGLPARPGNGDISDFSTGEVRSVPEQKTGWKRGDAIVEPQGVYRLTNGKLVMSRECRYK
jgi:large exoprotein involved in heme utilization and adhesion